ncbi:MAG TPA: septum formation initiator family protein [Candidatus Saccharimonadales bacterium]|nr:septum formation initiator family protein [Candidatus Saccharimonadales bacterium]
MLDKTNILAKLEPYNAMLRAYVLTLRDVRNVGVLVFTVILVLITWSGIKAVQTNYGLQKQISQLQQENDVQKLQNANLAFQNQYFTTNQYKETTARQNLGLGTAGEIELLIPKNVALAHTVKQPSASTVSVAVPAQPFWQHNFRAWIDFFLHRGTIAD